MSEIALPRTFSGGAVVAPERVQVVDTRLSDDIPMNEYGIVVLDNPQHCNPETCVLTQRGHSCFVDLDHSHHSGEYYAKHSDLAEEFRSQEAVCTWLARCIHIAKHETYPSNVPIPSKKVMKQSIKEARLLRDMEAAYRATISLGAILEEPGLTPWYRNATRRGLDQSIKEKKKLVKSVDSIEFLPQEIVTGALLLVAPGEAWQRLVKDPRYVLPGTIRREDVSAAWTAAETMLEERDEHVRIHLQMLAMDRAWIEAAELAA